MVDPCRPEHLHRCHGRSSGNWSHLGFCEVCSPTCMIQSPLAISRCMAHFFLLEGRMNEIAVAYFAKTQEAADARQAEWDAALRIQRCYHGSLDREVYHAKLHCIKRFQCTVRGFLGRRRARIRQNERTRALESKFFHHCAAVIQKIVRGRRSRRVFHDFHGRKGYLKQVEERGEWTTQFLQRQYTVKLAEAKEREENQMKGEFNALASELHHLVSTQSIAGVYNPPYSEALPKAVCWF